MPVVTDLDALEDDDAYALGLWCADGYHRSSSIGLSNVDPILIRRFGAYLARAIGRDRLRLRIYATAEALADNSVLRLTPTRTLCPPVRMKRPAYHLYVNSRPLLRRFRQWRTLIGELDDQLIAPYLAGRFDGDGSLGSGRVPGSRICYSSEADAVRDQDLMRRVGIKRVGRSHYRKAAEWCLYVHAPDDPAFRALIAPYSSKLATFRTSPAPVRT